MAAERFDVVVVGGGANGLTAAAYLQRSGADVVVLDKRFEWGGTLATDDYSTPFFYNLCQYQLPFGQDLPPYQDLELHREGLRMRDPDPVASFVPAGGGEPLVVDRDAQALAHVRDHLEAIDAALPALLYLPPVAEEELEEALGRNPHTKLTAEFARFTPASLAEELGEHRARALARYLCAQLGFVDDDTPLGLLGAVAFARQLRPSIAHGGSKALADALFRAGARSGAQYRAVADVISIEQRGEGFVAACHDGREYEARAVISTLDPQSTFVDILDDGLVPEGLRAAAADWRHDRVGPFTAHYGIKGQPPRIADGVAAQALIQVIGFADAQAVTQHVRTVADGHVPAEPAGHLTVTTHHDATQAAPGPFGPLHTLRFQTPAPFLHPDGDWDHRRAEYRTRCWELIAAHATGADDVRVLFAFADGPEDITRRFRTTRAGTPRQGALVREQTFVNRPHPDLSTCRTPLERFYVGGGSVHPGLPGSLGGGYHAARVVCEDLRLDRWRPEPSLVGRARDAGALPEQIVRPA